MLSNSIGNKLIPKKVLIQFFANQRASAPRVVRVDADTFILLFLHRRQLSFSLDKGSVVMSICGVPSRNVLTSIFPPKILGSCNSLRGLEKNSFAHNIISIYLHLFLIIVSISIDEKS